MVITSALAEGGKDAIQFDTLGKHLDLNLLSFEKPKWGAPTGTKT
jgi:hypothetical protein